MRFTSTPLLARRFPGQGDRHWSRSPRPRRDAVPGRRARRFRLSGRVRRGRDGLRGRLREHAGIQLRRDPQPRLRRTRRPARDHSVRAGTAHAAPAARRGDEGGTRTGRSAPFDLLLSRPSPPSRRVPGAGSSASTRSFRRACPHASFPGQRRAGRRRLRWRAEPGKGCRQAIDIAAAAGLAIDVYGDAYDASYALEQIEPRRARPESRSAGRSPCLALGGDGQSGSSPEVPSAGTSPSGWQPRRRKRAALRWWHSGAEGSPK